jgi:hypothetical protein
VSAAVFENHSYSQSVSRWVFDPAVFRARKIRFYGAGWPGFKMKNMPEKPATSFVLFETAWPERVGRRSFMSGLKQAAGAAKT